MLNLASALFLLFLVCLFFALRYFQTIGACGIPPSPDRKDCRNKFVEKLHFIEQRDRAETLRNGVHHQGY